MESSSITTASNIRKNKKVTYVGRIKENYKKSKVNLRMNTFCKNEVDKYSLKQLEDNDTGKFNILL